MEIPFLGICNHEQLFTDIYVGCPGRMHDARVFRNSPIYTRMVTENQPLLQPDQHLIGDSAYPLMINLMTPFRNNGHLTEEQTRYNVKLSAIRSIIERAFGRLKGKFRRLKFLDVLTPAFGCEIITAACVLHNFILLNGPQEEDEAVDYDNAPLEMEEGNEGQANQLFAAQKRLYIVNSL